jgi:hypothetical protein
MQTRAGQLDKLWEPQFRSRQLGQELCINKKIYFVLTSVHPTTADCFQLVTSLLSLDNILTRCSRSAYCTCKLPELYILTGNLAWMALWAPLVQTRGRTFCPTKDNTKHTHNITDKDPIYGRDSDGNPAGSSREHTHLHCAALWSAGWLHRHVMS